MDDPKDVGQTDDVKVEAAKNADVEGVEIEADEEQSVGKMTHSDIRTALSSILGQLLNSAAYTSPKSVKRLVKALKKLQLKHVEIEIQFFRELHDLEIKYEKKFKPLYEKRCAIVNGIVNPTDEECDYQYDSENETETSNEVQKVDLEDEEMKEEPDKDIKGIPGFWLTAFKNAPYITDTIQEYDEPILKHLIDVKAVTVREPMSFYIEFHFEPNDYFTNTVLTKYYEMMCAPDPTDVFAFEGPEIIKSKGCTIEWKNGKNVTVKTLKEKKKHKAGGVVKTVTQTERNDSFFNFFNSPAVPDNKERDMDEETKNIVNDFQVGMLIRDRIIPEAVLFFTGENMVFDECDENDEDEDDDYEDIEENEDDDKGIEDEYEADNDENDMYSG